tara:strand:- start:727 stop:1002 length:276 start_codon:yes stop_codon:yes gene_type:complete
MSSSVNELGTYNVMRPSSFLISSVAVEPLLDEKGVARARELADLHEARAEQALQEMWNLKLGLEPLDTTSFIDSLIPILVKTEADYTIFFR